jgi:hypothetical protein
MRKIFLNILLSLVVLVPPATASASWTLRRFLVAAGANRGAKDRAPLKYAVSDAESLARILQEMGGGSPPDCTILREPSMKTLQETLQALRSKIVNLREANVRYEVVFYYSGHADQKGLLLGTELFPYQSLRQWMDGLNADLRIAILDGCASGAITRIKGGKRQKAFLIDESSNMRGYAFLTSSTENEAAQESERVRGSFFTYYLMTGMRGAADVSGDGKVTLDEAYQFAYQETLARTLKTQGGTQHPAYDMNLIGTGNVVITDIRQTSAGMILSEELAGRLFIRDENNQLVAELQKPAGRAIELGLEPGKYNLDFQRPSQIATATVELKTGERLVLKNSAFQTVSTEATAARGEPGAGTQGSQPARVPPPLFRRSRIELGITAWPNSSGATVSTSASKIQSSVSGALSYWYRARPNLAVGINLSGGYSAVASSTVAGVFSLTPVAKYYVFKSALATPFNPYVKAGIGPYFGGQVVTSGTETTAVFGAFVGGGLDIRLSSRFFLYVDGGYHALTSFSHAIGGRKNYSGGEVSVGIGWQFGKPVPVQETP